MADTPATPRVRVKPLPDYLKINEDGSATITLGWPITVAGTKVGTVNMRRPKVRDRRSSEKGATNNGEVELAMFTKLTDLAPEDIEELDMDDYARFQAAFTSFLSSRTPVKSDEQS